MKLSDLVLPEDAFLESAKLRYADAASAWWQPW